ncbi:unnamed protein product [Staurois parvus]|uniref:Uncharacterized protein n=1 Tax=Staurois parvus TaxID=386267 RepID=A0ABN9EL19_9NEOB|nr:unnamed protein product [Staurois parvus]
MISVAPAVPPVSVHQCQCSSMPPASATSMPHIGAYHINATYQCPSELPFSATCQCHLSMPVSAA